MSLGYRVFVLSTAQADIRDYVHFMIVEHGSKNAARAWERGLRREISALKDRADIYSLVPEASLSEKGFRSFQYHSHRVIFRVESARFVAVQRVYHGARRPLKPKDL